MRSLAVCFALAWVASAAVEGVVTNQTTGTPQGGVTVTLVELGSGMKTVGSVQSGADGKFTFDVAMQAGAPYLLQALHQNVNYNRMLPPGSAGTGVGLDVYNASATARSAQVSQDMFLLEPSGTEMVVSERLVFTNSGNVTYLDPNGTVKLFIPTEATGPVQVRIVAPQGVPINRQAEKTADPNIYVIRYPMKPGETNIDVAYAMPMSGESTTFTGKVLHRGGPVRFVAPSGVKLDGPFEDAGPIPGTSATAYTLKGREFSLTVTGKGSLRASVNAPEGGGEGDGEDRGPGIDVRRPLIYDKLPWVLSLAGAMLAIGFVLLLRRPAPVKPGSQR